MLTHQDLTEHLQGGDSAVDKKLAAAFADVQDYCGWHIAPQRSETFTVDVYDRGVLFIPTMQLAGVTAVTQNGIPVDLATVTWDPAGTIRRATGHSFHGTGRVTVTVTHGYTVLPDNVRDVVLGLAHRRLDNPAGRQRAQESDLMDVFGPATLTDGEKATLDAYRIPVLG
jgi:hypothetical protein